jgi:hypothetical protein
VAIYERGKQPAIHISGYRDVIRLRQKVANRFLTIPVAFDLVSVLVEPAASVAVGEYIGIVILKRGLGHKKMILLVYVIAESILGGKETRLLRRERHPPRNDIRE